MNRPGGARGAGCTGAGTGEGMLPSPSGGRFCGLSGGCGFGDSSGGGLGGVQGGTIGTPGPGPPLLCEVPILFLPLDCCFDGL